MDYDIIDSPLGPILIAATSKGLCYVNFQNGLNKRIPDHEWVRNETRLSEVKEQISAYFAGTLKTFILPLDLKGTEFQRNVWSALQKIPYGTTMTYGELAQQIGKPKAARAVGNANNANPIPIIIPCHRVIGSRGELIGYAGGVEIKSALLKFEANH